MTYLPLYERRLFHTHTLRYQTSVRHHLSAHIVSRGTRKAVKIIQRLL